MNGIHEVTGSTPVWSITLSLRSSVLDHPVLRRAAKPSASRAGSTPVWSTTFQFAASHRVASRSCLRQFLACAIGLRDADDHPGNHIPALRFAFEVTR